MITQDLKQLQGYIRALPKLHFKKEDNARVALVTDDGTEYHILYKGVGMELTEHINANAQLTGTVQKLEDDVFTIHVRSFELTDGFEDEWYDDTLD